jgi:hypothetical protein
MCLDQTISLTVMGEAGFCRSSIPLPFRSNSDQQKFAVTCRFSIHSKTPKFLWILIEFEQKMLEKKERKKRESVFFCYS